MRLMDTCTRIGNKPPSIVCPFMMDHREKPLCWRCGSVTAHQYKIHPHHDPARLFNECTNPDCQQFMSYCDELGNNFHHPKCQCKKRSKRVVDRDGHGGYYIYYTCQAGKCDYYFPRFDWSVTQTDVMKAGFEKWFAKSRL